jgi:hypothetical protein
MSTLRRFFLGCSIGVMLASAAGAAPDDAAATLSLNQISLAVGAIGIVVGVVAVFLALQARRLAEHAAQEAGQARARASQGSGAGVSTESMAGLERVWSAKLAALEARLPGGGGGGGRPVVARETDHASNGFAARLEELERIVAGLAVTVKDSRRPAPAPATPAREPSEVVWPNCLSAETSAMNDVRQTLAQALKSPDTSARELLDQLRVTDHWVTKKPGSSEVTTTLTEISLLLLAALRRGAAVAPLDGSLLSDRVLAGLRPHWKPFLPNLDCRSFYPGATFDPEWMEDHTKAGFQRPVISEMLSWAVFEKTDKGRRVVAKARTTAE